jgi:transcription initiation factor IIE alpha subunit
MKKYVLTDEGRARLKRRKISVDAGMSRKDGYEVLDYLYEHGAATLEEIENDAGISRNKIIEKLLIFLNHELVEELAQ